MIINKYSGKCQSCSDLVSPGEGFVYKNGFRWLTVCTSTACQRRLGLVDAQVNLKREQEKQLYEDGRIVMPYDQEALPFLRSLPGAKWDSDNKCWRCSTARRKRAGRGGCGELYRGSGEIVEEEE